MVVVGGLAKLVKVNRNLGQQAKIERNRQEIKHSKQQWDNGGVETRKHES